jgi:hypothetical protein
MKLIIAGSRDITDYEVVREAIIESGFWRTYKRDIEVVCGMALSWKWHEDPLIGGVDRLGYRFAENNGLTIHEFPANWKKYGKKAGMMRNIEMGEFSDGLLAVWDGQSTGTKQMIDWASDNGLEYYVFLAP